MAGDAVICQQGILGEAADSQGGGLISPETVSCEQAGSGQNPITFKETRGSVTKPMLSFVLVASGCRVYSSIWFIFHYRTLRDSVNNFVS